jgi:hypothetical protein
MPLRLQTLHPQFQPAVFRLLPLEFLAQELGNENGGGGVTEYLYKGY